MTAPQPPPSGDAAARAERVMQEHSAAEGPRIKLTRVLLVYLAELFKDWYEYRKDVALAYACIGYKHGLLTRRQLIEGRPPFSRSHQGRHQPEKSLRLYYAITELWDTMDKRAAK